MPGPIVHQNAVVLCSHGGTATAVAPFPRVTVGGMPVVVLTTPMVVAGCGLSGSGSPPCATGQWLVGATRVLAGGVPVVVVGSASLAAPTGTPLVIASTQTRVNAT